MADLKVVSVLRGIEGSLSIDDQSVDDLSRALSQLRSINAPEPDQAVIDRVAAQNPDQKLEILRQVTRLKDGNFRIAYCLRPQENGACPAMYAFEIRNSRTLEVVEAPDTASRVSNISSKLYHPEGISLENF